MTVRLDAGSAALVATRHEAAAKVIDDSATGAPDSVDAGLGAAEVAEILAAVSETAGEIAYINAGIAALVRDAADDIGNTDSEVGAAFDRMREADK